MCRKIRSRALLLLLLSLLLVLMVLLLLLLLLLLDRGTAPGRPQGQGLEDGAGERVTL